MGVPALQVAGKDVTVPALYAGRPIGRHRSTLTRSAGGPGVAPSPPATAQPRPRRSLPYGHLGHRRIGAEVPVVARVTDDVPGGARGMQQTAVVLAVPVGPDRADPGPTLPRRVPCGQRPGRLRALVKGLVLEPA